MVFSKRFNAWFAKYKICWVLVIIGCGIAICCALLFFPYITHKKPLTYSEPLPLFVMTTAKPMLLPKNVVSSFIDPHGNSLLIPMKKALPQIVKPLPIVLRKFRPALLSKQHEKPLKTNYSVSPLVPGPPTKSLVPGPPEKRMVPGAK